MNEQWNEWRYLASNGIYGTQSIFISFIGIISSFSLCTDLTPIWLDGEKGDTTCSQIMTLKIFTSAYVSYRDGPNCFVSDHTNPANQ